jgi:hypothetical protein
MKIGECVAVALDRSPEVVGRAPVRVHVEQNRSGIPASLPGVRPSRRQIGLGRKKVVLDRQR